MKKDTLKKIMKIPDPKCCSRVDPCSFLSTFDFLRLRSFRPRVEHLQGLIDFPVLFIDVVQRLDPAEDDKLASTRRDVDAKVVQRIGNFWKLEVKCESHCQVLAQVIN